MVLNDFNQIMREHMNYSDSDTVHAIAEASDNNQNQMLVALTSKLYDLITAKADKVDFSSISRSRGDITKIEKYEQLVECIDVIRNIIISYKEDTRPVDVVSMAIENLKTRVNMFKKAFVIGASLPMLTYNTIGLSIVYSISFLISTCIEYIKDPGSETFRMALDTVAYNKTDSNLLFTNLESFNEGCKSGDFDKAMDLVINQAKVRRESTEIEVKPDAPFLTPEEIQNDTVLHDEEDTNSDEINVSEGLASQAAIFAWKHKAAIAAVGYLATRGLLFLAKYAIPMLRNLVYFIFSTKQKVSDFWAVQADLLEMNAYQLQYNDTLDVDEKKKIMDKQLKIAAKWKARANKWSVDYTTSKKNAEKMSSDEVKKYTVSDIDYVDKSDDSVLF